MVSPRLSGHDPDFSADLMAYLTEAVLLTDADGYFTFISPNTDALLGYTQAEIAAISHIRHLFSHWSEEQIADLQRDQHRIETTFSDRSHHRHEVRLHIRAVTLGLGRWLYVVEDIGEHKRLEQSLSQINQQFESQVQRHSRELSVFHRALDAAAIVAMTDADGVITFVNDRFCDISGYSREELIGQTHRLIKADHHPSDFFKDMWNTIRQGQVWRGEVCNRHKDGHLYWMDTAISPFLGDDDDKPVQYLAVRFDITRRKHMEEALQSNVQMLTAISRAQAQFITLANRLTIFEDLLNTLLELTNSEYGFIGEVLFRADGSAQMEESLMKIRGVPYLKTHSITNIAWNAETQQFYADNYEQGMEFTNLKTLFGAVIMTGQPVIANNPATDPRRGGIPSGHPPLDAFLGLPLFQGDQLIGMVGIANCPGGYREAVIAELQPFLVTCSILIEGYRLDRQRREAEGQLHQTNQELARATRLKDEFLANMSHELRTPLNAILGMTEGLREEIFGPITDGQITALTTIERSGNHLLDLINDILDLAKIEAGRITLNVQPTALESICQTSYTFVRQQAQHKHIRLTLDLPPNLPLVMVDERRVFQVLINLLANAVKFTPNGGLVTLTAGSTWTVPPALQGGVLHPILPPPSPAPSPQPEEPAPPRGSDYLYLSIADTGIGIADADLPQLFQPFVQIDSALNRQYQGTGLGLALVKRIMELHGGSLQLTSRPGVGSCLILGLPTVVSPQAPSPDPRDSEDLPPLDSLPNPGSSDHPLVVLAAAQSGPTSTIETYLRAKGYPLRRAETGAEALALAPEAVPQVWLIDVHLPDMEALGVIEHLHQDPQRHPVAIIALTSGPTSALQETYLAAGANLCLGQPLSMRKLVNAIDYFAAPL